MIAKIVADSSCDLLSLEGIAFSSVPLKIRTDEREFTDDASLNVEEMVNYLEQYQGRSFTSCPNVAEWEEAFAGDEDVFAFAITSGISGSYNAAVNARAIVLEGRPEKKIHVFNSLTAGPENVLLIRRTIELIEAGETFEEICRKVEEYSASTHLLFALESLHNFVQNGRVSKIAAAAADLLGIRVLGIASEKGELEMLSKARGQKKIIAVMVAEMKKRGYAGGKVILGETLNPDGAHLLENAIHAEFPDAEISIYPMRGLCSYYAQKGGLLAGFECKKNQP